MNADNSQHEVTKPKFSSIELLLVVVVIIIVSAIAYSAKPTYGNSCSNFYELDITDVQCSEIQSYVRRGWHVFVSEGDVVAQSPTDPNTYKVFLTTPDLY